MRIVVNCFPISDKRTGIGHYAYNIVRCLAEIENAELHLVFARDAGARHDFGGDAVQMIEAPLLTCQSLKRVTWENLALPRLLKERKADIYFSPDYILPLRPLPCPSVIAVHDLAFIMLPGTKNWRYGTYLRRMVPLSARHASAVIAISDYTKGEVVRLLGVPAGRVKRIYYGRDEGFGKESGKKKKSGDFRPYILYVGTLDPRKNIVRLVEAFSILKRKNKLDHCLLLAGPRKFGYSRIRSTIEELGLEQDVIETGYVHRDKLAALYSGASLFVLPSLYEGFGLPLLEAMACGIPIAASNATAIPEVTGNAALYFDPLDVDELASAILRLLEDRELSANFVQKGFERLKLFSWEKCARETMELFQAVVAHSKK